MALLMRFLPGLSPAFLLRTASVQILAPALITFIIPGSFVPLAAFTAGVFVRLLIHARLLFSVVSFIIVAIPVPEAVIPVMIIPVIVILVIVALIVRSVVPAVKTPETGANKNQQAAGKSR
jgi:hypothetical protein